MAGFVYSKLFIVISVTKETLIFRPFKNVQCKVVARVASQG